MEYTILILLLPLASFLVLGLAGMKMRPAAAGAVGTAVLAVVALLSYWTAFEYFSAGRDAAGVFPTLIPWNAVWLPIGGALHIDLGILLDPISVMMLVVISTVSLMVHIYSLGYMKGERGFQRYYAFLSLFTMSMIGLVVATNIFQMYLFWELVGVSSYLLIGFYYTKKEAVAASKKAFIVTRFADLGFLIGILVYGYYAGTFSFTPEAHALAAAGTMIPLALGLMFVGGAGKSAMFPLHIWLPDAMEGPTPVSALIHAATMVVAGVYLVARMFPLFIGYAPEVLHWTAYIGAFTALYAAVVACVQSDIKRVLAFSTISQIGFMLVALGVSTSADPHAGGLGYMASMFHLFTHAMFKALLFLGVKKALTTASTAAGWTGAEKTAALRTLGADLTAYYTRLEADAKFGTPYSLPPATADQLGGVKVGEALDIAPDGTLSAKTLNDKIAAAVAVKSEPRLVWNTHATSPNKFTTWDVQIPGNVDKICITKGRSSSSGNNTEKSIARGGTTTYDCNYDFTITFQTNGILHVANSYKTLYPLELWIDGYHYPTLADLLTQVTAVESSVTDLQVALCELYEEKEEN